MECVRNLSSCQRVCTVAAAAVTRSWYVWTNHRDPTDLRHLHGAHEHTNKHGVQKMHIVFMANLQVTLFCTYIFDNNWCTAGFHGQTPFRLPSQQCKNWKHWLQPEKNSHWPNLYWSTIWHLEFLNWDYIITKIICFYLFMYELCSTSCHEQSHVGCKTSIQQNPSVLNWGC